MSERLFQGGTAYLRCRLCISSMEMTAAQRDTVALVYYLGHSMPGRHGLWGEVGIVGLEAAGSSPACISA